jgi:HlyD family secretion protein
MSIAMNVWAKRVLWGFIALAAVGALVWALRPSPVPVDVGQLERDTLTVTVDEDGVTRVVDRYQISAPLSGQLQRIGWDAGDRVDRSETLARIAPTAPPLLDVRAQQEAQARVAAARASVERAQAVARRAEQAYRQAQREAGRQRELYEAGLVTGQAVEQAELEAASLAAERESARASVDVAQNELQLARSALETIIDGERPDGQLMEVDAPVDSQVLEVFEESAGVVQAGTPLMELGQLDSLEIVVDVLTTEAVAIEPDDPVKLVRWGGEEVLNGRVERVEPSAFTEVSSLGVEEQRVNVIVSPSSEDVARAGLGDGFRVEAEIVTWERDDVLQVDASAVFRSGDGWAVYEIVDGRAELTPIAVGRRTDRAVEVTQGLERGARVVLYPSDAVEAGVRVEPRRM